MSTPKKVPLGDVEYQLEQKMGDGSWSRVYQTKEEADYETPCYVRFATKQLAREYVAANGAGRYSADAIERGVVRLIEVRTTVTVVE